MDKRVWTTAFVVEYVLKVHGGMRCQTLWVVERSFGARACSLQPIAVRLLRRHGEVPTDSPLPDVLVHLARHYLLLLRREGRCGQLHVELIEDEHLDLSLGLLLLPETVKVAELFFDRREQLAARLLHTLPRRLPETILPEQVETEPTPPR